MELKEFRTLLEIERLGSISLAAKSLYISQPGLSQFLQNYEHQLGFPVFERQFQGVRPTQRGGEYLRMIRELVGTYDMSLAELRGENRRRIRFGIGDQRGSLVIPKIIAKMNEKDHGFKLEINDSISRQENLLAALKNHEVDAVATTIISEDYHTTGDITVYPILKEEIMLVMPKGHALTKHLRQNDGEQYWIDPEVLSNQTYILCDSRREIRKMSDQIIWQRNINNVNILQSSTSLFTVISSCLNCNALTFSPWEYVCGNDQCICASIGEEGIFWTHVMVARPKAFRKGERETLMNLIRESFLTDMKHIHVLTE